MGAWISSVWVDNTNGIPVEIRKELQSVRENIRGQDARASREHKRERLGQANLRIAILASLFGRDVAELISAAVERETIKDLFADAANARETAVTMARIDFFDRTTREEKHYYANGLNGANDANEMKDMIVIGSLGNIGIAHPRRTWTRMGPNFDLMRDMRDMSNGQVNVVHVTLDGIGYPLCYFQIARNDNLFRVSRVEHMENACVAGFDETKRMLIHDDRYGFALATLPMSEMSDASDASDASNMYVIRHAITLSLAYPVLKGLVGNPQVYFERMWGHGVGVCHAHHEFCHDTELPVDALSDHEKKAKTDYRTFIDAAIESLISNGRMYVTMRRR